MAAPSCPEDMLAQVTQLWNMLDEMAESSPESYHRFMQQQLEDAKQYCAPPEPHLCLQTHILVHRDPSEKSLFINLCRWKRVPAPKSPTDPIPLSAGPLEEVSDEAELYFVIDIAYNPTVLQKREVNQAEMDHLIRLTFKYVEEHYCLSLSQSYHIATFTLKGSRKRMEQSLRGGPPPAPLVNKNTRNDLTLDQIRHSLGEDSRNTTLLLNKDVKQSKAHLIEEIASMELPEESLTPAYELTVAKDANRKPLKIVLKVELPKVSSVSECELSISRDDIIVEVPEKYRLQLDLPELVDEEATTAIFNKGKGLLLITMPVP